MHIWWRKMQQPRLYIQENGKMIYVSDYDLSYRSQLPHEARFAQHVKHISACRDRAVAANASRALYWGLSDPKFTFLAPTLGQRLAAVAPHLKLVLLLREPMQRAYSEYAMFRPMHERANISFEALVVTELRKLAAVRNGGAASQGDHVARGLYAEQLAALIRSFPEDQLHITISECSVRDPLGEYNRIFRFLGVSTLTRLPVLKLKSYRISKAAPSNDTSWGGVHAAVSIQLFDYLHSSTAWVYAFLGARVALWDAWYADFKPPLYIKSLDAIGDMPCASTPNTSLYTHCVSPETLFPRRSKTHMWHVCNATSEAKAVYHTPPHPTPPQRQP